MAAIGKILIGFAVVAIGVLLILFLAQPGTPPTLNESAQNASANLSINITNITEPTFPPLPPKNETKEENKTISPPDEFLPFLHQDASLTALGCSPASFEKGAFPELNATLLTNAYRINYSCPNFKVSSYSVLPVSPSPLYSSYRRDFIFPSPPASEREALSAALAVPLYSAFAKNLLCAASRAEKTGDNWNATFSNCIYSARASFLIEGNKIIDDRFIATAPNLDSLARASYRWLYEDESDCQRLETTELPDRKGYLLNLCGFELISYGNTTLHYFVSGGGFGSSLVGSHAK